MNIKEATEEWVNGFNAIPCVLIERAYMDSYFEDLFEITPIVEGDRVDCECGSGEVIEVDREVGLVYIAFDDGTNDVVDIGKVFLDRDSFLPMWGTMWTFDDSADNWWLEDEENRIKMAECGFRIYECDELGYVFGIDGAGYSFIEHHFIPLYKARGLQWHNE